MRTPCLREPLTLPCGATLPNRLLKSAMTEGLADAAGRPQPAHERLYRRWSEGGSGTLITGNVMIDGRYLERPGNVVVEDDSALSALSSWARAATASGNHVWMQLSHPGRQCSKFVANEPVAPSAVQLRLGGLFGKPRALREHEIVEIIARYANSAAIARRAGFSGVQVHGAHGYLCSQFLSPRTNLRADAWGGSLQNRARFLREVVRAVRASVGADYPVSVKLNSSDFQRGAFTHEESCQVAAWLVEDGIDLLEISGGTYEEARLLGLGRSDGSGDGKAESTRRREAYFLEYASAIRQAAPVPLAVTGGFRSRSAMESALSLGLIDVVGLARPLCTEPELAGRLLAGAVECARRDESRLLMGSGWFGPNSSNATLRGLNAQAQTAWFYQQILQLAADQPIAETLSARRALLRHVRREYSLAKERRKLLREAPLLLPRAES